MGGCHYQLVGSVFGSLSFFVWWKHFLIKFGLMKNIFRTPILLKYWFNWLLTFGHGFARVLTITQLLQRQCSFFSVKYFTAAFLSQLLVVSVTNTYIMYRLVILCFLLTIHQKLSPDFDNTAICNTKSFGGNNWTATLSRS